MRRSLFWCRFPSRPQRIDPMSRSRHSCGPRDSFVRRSMASSCAWMTMALSNACERARTCSSSSIASMPSRPIAADWPTRSRRHSVKEKRYKQYIRVFLRQYQLAKTCPGCGGARLKPESLAVRVAGKTIAAASALTATDLASWLDQLELPAFQQSVADHILAELRARV